MLKETENGEMEKQGFFCQFFVIGGISIEESRAQKRTRDFEKGGRARNFRKFERNIDQNLKLPQSNYVPFFAQKQVKSKKKGLHSNFVPFFAQNQVKSKKKGLHYNSKSGNFEPKA